MGMFFTTSTVKDWYPLLNREEFRNIVISSMIFLIDQNRIKLHGYVVMPNHLHLIFTVLDPFHLHEIFRDFHKFTSQQILNILRNERSNLLVYFQSTRGDRRHQIWQTTHTPKEIVSFPFFHQKLDYIHWNPCTERWKLCAKPEEYPFSSAADYFFDTEGPIPIEKISP